jgi:hypothetical protein
LLLRVTGAQFRAVVLGFLSTSRPEREGRRIHNVDNDLDRTRVPSKEAFSVSGATVYSNEKRVERYSG